MTKVKKDNVPVLAAEEQKKLVKEELNKLIELSKKKGILTVEEINETLAVEIIAHRGLAIVGNGIGNAFDWL